MVKKQMRKLQAASPRSFACQESAFWSDLRSSVGRRPRPGMALSAYEQQRLDNIANNMRVLSALGHLSIEGEHGAS